MMSNMWMTPKDLLKVKKKKKKKKKKLLENDSKKMNTFLQQICPLN